MPFIKRVLIAGDQLLNALCGGDPDVTISARVGYHSRISSTVAKPYWRFLEGVIDFTFKPLDGEDHCYNSFLADEREHHRHGSDLARAILGVGVVLFCVVVIVLTMPLRLRPRQ